MLLQHLLQYCITFKNNFYEKYLLRNQKVFQYSGWFRFTVKQYLIFMRLSISSPHIYLLNELQFIDLRIIQLFLPTPAQDLLILPQLFAYHLHQSIHVYCVLSAYL